MIRRATITSELSPKTMNILITDNRIIHEIQAEFSALYPYLKIEFFSRKHKPGMSTAAEFMKSADKTISVCRRIKSDGVLDISPEMTVSQLEQAFSKIFGLNVQVFRKSGNVWLETTVTDGWTLEQQNTQGEALSSLSYGRD